MANCSYICNAFCGYVFCQGCAGSIQNVAIFFPFIALFFYAHLTERGVVVRFFFDQGHGAVRQFVVRFLPYTSAIDWGL